MKNYQSSDSQPSFRKGQIKDNELACFQKRTTLKIPEKTYETSRRHLAGFPAMSGEKGERAKVGVRRRPRTRSA